jgi:hypothetical protein
MTNEPKEMDDVVTEAESGYDVNEIIRRRGGRPLLGSSPSVVESVRLDPQLKRDLIVRAADQGISLSEAIRTALRQYTHSD